jgi:hypothetical protein
MEPPSGVAGEGVSGDEDWVATTIDTRESVRYIGYESLASGVASWVLLLVVVWLVSVYWVRAPWSQWVLLLVVPALVGIFAGTVRITSLKPTLEDIPADELKKIGNDPVASQKPGAPEAAQLVLRLKTAAETGSLVSATILNVTALPGLLTLAVAGFGTFVVWGLPRRRIAKAHPTEAPKAG